MKTKKSLIVLLLSAVVLLSFSSTAQAVIIDPSSKIADLISGGASFSLLKQAIIAGLDKCVAAISSIENKINANTKLSSATKTQINTALNGIKTALLSYKSKVEQATTVEELKSINQEIVNYLKNNKDVIKINLGKAIEELGQEALLKANELKITLEKTLAVLKITCPTEKDTIILLETQLAQLNTEIVNLQNALAAKNSTLIKTEIESLNDLSKAIVINVEKIQSSCLK